MLARLLVLVALVAAVVAAHPKDVVVKTTSGDSETIAWLKPLRAPVVLDSATSKMSWKLGALPDSATALLVLSRADGGTKTLAFGGPKGALMVDLGKPAMAAHFAANPGSYKATIYYRDAETSPVTWPVGTVEFRFAPVAVKKSTSSKNALPTESERLKDFQPLPEIHHIMQRKEKTPPPTVVSFAFSLIVLLPWLFLVPAWSRLGVNVSNFPLRSSAVFGAASFLGCLATFAVALFVFWTSWNMFEAAAYFTPIAMALAITGKSAIGNYALAAK